jgi:hypothetical protein
MNLSFKYSTEHKRFQLVVINKQIAFQMDKNHKICTSQHKNYYLRAVKTLEIDLELLN